MSGEALAAAAASLVGTRFRLHGRDPAIGLDCVGLLAAALEHLGRPSALPNGYRLRNRDIAAWLPDPAACGFAPVSDGLRPGDVVLTRPGPGQVHLAIAASAGGWVHAHAGLRRVVHQPGGLPGEALGHWRLLPES